MSDETLRKIGEIGVVPVITIDDPADALPLGEALLEGGVNCIEITLRTEAALASIEALRKGLPQLLIGAGTVLSLEQAAAAHALGVQFVVTPGLDQEIVDWSLDRNLPIVPGAVTATEITLARKKGLRVLKFFPAEVAGGPKAIKAIAGPFHDVKFVPTGGITQATLADYAGLATIHACGGSWMAGRSLIADGNWNEITRRSKDSLEIVQQARKAGS